MIALRILWTATPAWAKAALVGALVLLAVGVGAYSIGVQNERQRAAQEAAEDYREGRRDADDALGDLPADDDGIREWLRRFGD